MSSVLAVGAGGRGLDIFLSPIISLSLSLSLCRSLSLRRRKQRLDIHEERDLLNPKQSNQPTISIIFLVSEVVSGTSR